MNMQEKDLTEAYSLIGFDISEAEELLQIFGNVRFVDEKICEKLSKDNYLMKRVFAVDEDYIDVYYDRANGTITDVNILN